MTDEAPVLKLTIDLEYSKWMLPAVSAYRKAVGVNPDYAAAQIYAAFTGVMGEAREAFGESVDVPGWEPPEGWVPGAVLNIDPAHLLGFLWIPARQENQALTFDEFAATVPYGAMLEAFWSYMQSSAEEAAEAAPLEAPNRATRRASGQRSRTGSPSRTLSAGPSKTSTRSPSASSSPPSTSTTS